MTRSRRIGLLAVLAAIGYGGIAFIVNNEYGYSAALTAAITQAVVCAFATLTTTSLMEFMFSVPQRRWSKYLLASLGSGSIVLLVFLVSHTLMNTPNILMTLGSAAIIAGPYYTIYPMVLLSLHSKQQQVKRN